MRPAELCRALGQALARPTTLVDDARSVREGDAVHIIHGDVQWIVVWLVHGRVRGWTRVSKIEAAEHQQRFIVRAARALAELSPAPPVNECVRLEVGAHPGTRSPDLTYPWAELRPCQRRLVEVVDPWWLPPDATKKGARHRPAS